MPKIIQSLALLTFDGHGAARALEAVLLDILKIGVREWVQVAEDNIPVWSGASRATLSELASKVGINVSVFPVAGAPNRVSLGAGSGHGELIFRNGRFGFVYSTNLPHLIRNETQDMSRAMRGRLRTPTPYQFRAKADKAFREIIGKELSRIGVAKLVRNALTVKNVRST